MKLYLLSLPMTLFFLVHGTFRVIQKGQWCLKRDHDIFELHLFLSLSGFWMVESSVFRPGVNWDMKSLQHIGLWSFTVYINSFILMVYVIQNRFRDQAV